MKTFELTKTDFEFRNDDISYEFKESISHVFEGKNTIYFVFKKSEKVSKIQKGHIREYFKNRGWIKVKFFKQ